MLRTSARPPPPLLPLSPWLLTRPRRLMLLLLLISGAQALAELLESDDKFGFIVMDGNGSLFGACALSEAWPCRVLSSPLRVAPRRAAPRRAAPPRLVTPRHAPMLARRRRACLGA